MVISYKNLAFRSWECKGYRNKKCAECIVELYKYTGFIKNTTEVLEKQTNASRTSRVFLKNPKCLYNSTMYEEQVFLNALVPMMQTACIISRQFTSVM